MEDSQVIDSAYGENGQNGYKCGIEVRGVWTGVARAYLGLLFFLEDSTLLSSVNLALLLLTTVVDGFVVYLFVLQRLFRRFLFLSLYFLLSVTLGIAWCITHFKISSVGYRDFFFIAYDWSTVFLLLSVVELSLRISGTKLRPWEIIMWGIPLALDCFIVALLTDARVIMLFWLRPSEGVLFMCCCGFGSSGKSLRMGSQLDSSMCLPFISCCFFWFWGPEKLLPLPPSLLLTSYLG